MSVRVINLGLPKTGTTTLAVALEKAGLVVADFRLRRGSCPDKAIAGSFVARQLYDGYYGSGDPLQRLGSIDALTEISVLNQTYCLWPQTDFGLIEALRNHHPDLRFVASWRAPQDVAQSMLRWSDLGTDRLPRGNVPGLPRGYGETRLQRVQWVTQHYAFLDRLFAGDPRYLCYDTAAPDAPRRIEAHLGLSLPWWGRANENRSA
ncbi:sulfotransferase family protein [Citreicella sp. C3M06]|uniref:sulfotransferase family protein n=1 Tax=Citreicella sp. C3M06 TaxID=2841564 RepID=UPI001C09F92A|nr:sulfotransferase family protein [Citreicella sp. C3M06]MBU2963381.1 sulfotransferase family protein [Citreicella sp. C3M06]